MAEVLIPLGREARIYIAAPGTLEAAFADSGRLKGARDVTVAVEKEEADVKRRISGAWADIRPGTKDLRVTFDLVGVVPGATDPSGEAAKITTLRKTNLTELYDGTGDTGIAMYIRADGLAAGQTGGGPYADFIITRFERVETHGEPQVYNVEAKLSQTQNRALGPVGWGTALPV